ncbi:hypothetical protein B0H14DRAFT_2780765 [Mycena olivaceomarginata]|nr:hypothetical protein B0H14DRAFT_2780765 [Mycena olivaceomarginata]
MSRSGRSRPSSSLPGCRSWPRARCLVYGQSRINVTVPTASTKLNSRSMFHFDAWVDWRQRHAFLKCACLFARA